MAEHATRLDLVPAVTAAQMREVDRNMVEDLGVSLLQMMENAGRAFAELTRIQLSGVRHRRVVVLAGQGGNGGGGMAAARRLAIWGAEVRVVLAHPATALAEAPTRQLASLRAIDVAVHSTAEAASLMQEADVVLDALLGYSLDGPPREPEAGLIRAANAHAIRSSLSTCPLGSILTVAYRTIRPSAQLARWLSPCPRSGYCAQKLPRQSASSGWRTSRCPRELTQVWASLWARCLLNPTSFISRGAERWPKSRWLTPPTDS